MTKLSEIADGGLLNPATDQLVAVRDDDTDVLVTPFTWSEVTGTAQALAAGNGYIMNNAALVVGTLPTTAPEGTEIKICGKGAGGWEIAQNTGQTIYYGTGNTTTGTGGSLASQHTYDSVDLLCIVANTAWVVRGSQGNLTIT